MELFHLERHARYGSRRDWGPAAAIRMIRSDDAGRTLIGFAGEEQHVLDDGAERIARQKRESAHDRDVRREREP